MKTKLTTIGSLLILCLAALSVRADIILSDDFTYSDGSITNVSNGKWALHSGNNDFNVVSGAAQVNAGVGTAIDTGDVNATLTNAPYATNGPVAALYAKFTINVATLPAGGGGRSVFRPFQGHLDWFSSQNLCEHERGCERVLPHQYRQ